MPRSTRAAAKCLTELSQLVEIGVEHILITGIPDVGLIPDYDLQTRADGYVLDGAEIERSAAATEFSIYLDTLIRTDVVPALEAMGATVTYVPLMDYVDANGSLVTGALSANLPTIAALHGLTTEELTGNLLEHQRAAVLRRRPPQRARPTRCSAPTCMRSSTARRGSRSCR